MLEWFTTIPGILILCGVILLVIAVILFIAGSKKPNNSVVNEEKPVQNTDNTMNTQPASELENVNPVPVAPVEVVESVSAPTVDNNSVDINTTIDPMFSVQEQFTANQPVAPSMPEQPTPSVINIPSEDNNVVDAFKIEEPVSFEHPIYGGEVPTANISIEEEKPVTIYGGNDPLEATQTLPKVEEHHEPYNGVYPEVRIVEPMAMPTVEDNDVSVPVEEVISSLSEQNVDNAVFNMPSVEPIVQNNVEVTTQEPVSFQSEPVVEQVSNEQQYQFNPEVVASNEMNNEPQVSNQFVNEVPTIENVQTEPVQPVVEEL